MLEVYEGAGWLVSPQHTHTHTAAQLFVAPAQSCDDESLISQGNAFFHIHSGYKKALWGLWFYPLQKNMRSLLQNSLAVATGGQVRGSLPLTRGGARWTGPGSKPTWQTQCAKWAPLRQRDLQAWVILSQAPVRLSLHSSRDAYGLITDTRHWLLIE